MKRNRYVAEKSRNLFSDATTETKSKRKRKSHHIGLKLYNLFCIFTNFMFRLIVSIVVTAVVSFFATAVLTSIANDISLSESISTIFLKVKEFFYDTF